MTKPQLIRSVALYTVFGAGAVLALIATVQSFAPPRLSAPVPAQPTIAVSTQPAPPRPPSLPSATDDGVTVQVAKVERTANQTTVTLTMDNHQFDLGSLDGKSRTTFNGVAPRDYRVLQSASGGHHVSSQLTFDGTLSGQLTVGLGNDLTFSFTLP